MRMPHVDLSALTLALALSALAAACGNNAEFAAGSPKKGAAPAGDAVPGKDNTDPNETDAGSNASQPQSIERTFPVTEQKSGEVTFSPELGLLSHDVTLANRYEQTQATFVQVDRPTVMDSFLQGATGTSQSQTFYQTHAGILDMVLVVDNSGSMSQEQANLADKLAPLLEYVKDSDWRINIVTTDPDETCSRDVLKKGESNLDQRFRNAVNAGTNGSGNERGIQTAVQALSCQTVDWTRLQSTVAVLIVSDEDNCSYQGSECGTDPWNTEQYLLDHLHVTMGRTLGVDARVYGIYWIPGTSCSSGAYRAEQYAAAVAATNGTAGSICDADYSATLSNISQNVGALLKAQFALTAAPTPGTTVVKVDGVTVTSGWSVSGTTLTFSTPPANGATIEVSYDTGARPILTRWPLREVPATGTLAVTVNGTTAPASAYSIDPTTHELVFASAPAENAQIVATYLRDEPLVKSLDLGFPAKDGAVTVTVDGSPTTAFSYEPTGGTNGGPRILLDTAPADGAVVVAAFVANKGKILDYPLPIVGSPQQVEIVDATTGAAVNATLDGTTLKVASAEFVEGREIRVKYGTSLGSATRLSLPDLPDAGSVQIAVEGSTCREGEGITVSAKAIEVSCDFSGVSEVKLTYTYRTPVLTSFTLDDVVNPDVGAWAVYVDDVETKAYTRAGKTITLNTAPAPTAVVRIKYVLEGT